MLRSVSGIAMSDPSPTTLVVALVLAFTLLEGAVLWGYDRLTRRGLPSRTYLLNWLSGLALLSAMLLVSRGAGVAAVAPWLLAAGLLHAWDLKRNWRRNRRAA